MNEKHLQRLEREAGLPGLIDALSQRLSPTDLQSLMLEVYRRRALALTPKDVLRRYKESRFTRPSPLSTQAMLKVQNLANQALNEEFTAVELSPLAPLGCCSTLATCDQNKIVSTVRNLEVAADPTNALALEAALRRRQQPEVHLAAYQRLVRAQYFEGPECYGHFTVFCLVSSGRDGRAFLRRQLAVVRRLIPDLDLAFTPLDELGEKWVQDYPEDRIDRQRESGRGYYQHLCYKVYFEGVDVGDGGFTDWTAQLLGDRKEKLLIAGIGCERLAARL